MSKTGNSDGNVLSRTADDYERLCGQAESWSPFTQRFLVQVGLDTGITAPDAGCGSGEVMRLMARRVGLSRSVTGVDIDPEAGARGGARLQADVISSLGPTMALETINGFSLSGGKHWHRA